MKCFRKVTQTSSKICKPPESTLPKFVFKYFILSILGFKHFAFRDKFYSVMIIRIGEDIQKFQCLAYKYK